MKDRWLIYGANGYTGKLVTDEALKRGHKPILSGRSAAVRKLAEPLGLEARAFPLERAKEFLSDVAVVLHCAGPFSETAKPMIEACLATGTHYLDITGEIDVLEWTLAQDARAKKAGTFLLSGAGFDVVPSDCLAKHLAERLPGAEELELAFTGSASLSPGTLKTMVKNLPQGGRIRRGGKIVKVPAAYADQTARFAFGDRRVTTIPWGDVATAFHTTGIPNIKVYGSVPKAMKLTRYLGPVLASRALQGFLNRWIDKNVPGPSEEHRKKAKMFLWGRASKGDRSVEARLQVAEGYHFTALSMVAIAETLKSGAKAGAWTPAKALGTDFVLKIPGSERVDLS